MSSSINLILADDHPLFRKGLRQAIEEDTGMKIIGEAGDGTAALSLLQEHTPDAAILDINMPGMSGLEIAQHVQRDGPFVAIVILTNYKDERMFDEAMDAGVRGYVLKDTAVVDTLEAIRAVTMGRYYFSPGLSDLLAKRSQRAKTLLQERPSLATLTPTERRILRLIGTHNTSKEIADEFHISYRTVETHRTNIATKLNIHGSHSLLKFAIENKSALQDQ